MRSSLTSQRSAGFTLIEVLIIAPVVILAISGFVALMVVMAADVLVTRDNNNMTYETQDTLDLIEQDTRLATQFLVTTQGLPSPQGRDNDFTGTAAFTNTNDALIMGALTTTKNPADPTRKVVFYAGQPNVCGPRESYNRPLLSKIIYYKRDTSLWRRVVLPDYNTNVTINDNTVCATPWQRNSCRPGYSAATRCQTNDAEIMQNVDSFSVKYFSDPASTTDLGNGNALNATTIEVTITGKKKTAGRDITSSASLRATRLNSIDVSIPPPAVPDVSSQINGNTVTFSWPKVPTASSYALYYNTNGGAWTEVIVNALTTSYSVTAGPGDTITFHNYARNHAGASTQGIAVATIPNWYTCNLQNGWVNYDNVYTTPGYAKTTQDVVVLKGLVRSGNAASGTVLCVLPQGYRPTHRLIFPVSTSDGGDGRQGRIDILQNGEVQIIDGNNQWISFDNIRFLSSSAPYTWTNASLINSWVNYGYEYSPLRTAKDLSGRTHIEGLIKDGIYTPNATPVATLPLGHRPAQYTHFPAKANMSFNYTAFGANVDAKGINPNGWYNIQAMFYASGFSGWTNLPLLNSWVSFDSGGHSTPQYTKSADKIVTVKGLIKSGNATAGYVIAQLPAGYRPKERTINHCVAWASYCRVDIRPDGYIEVRVANSGWTSLDAISFIAEQ